MEAAMEPSAARARLAAIVAANQEARAETLPDAAGDDLEPDRLGDDETPADADYAAVDEDGEVRDRFLDALEAELGDEPIITADIDAGKLFDIPRVTVKVDDSDPNILKLAFSGSIEADRNDPGWVKFYNRLEAGRTVQLEVSAHVAGATRRHRRDKDGYVDAVVETKSLVVTDIHLA